MELALIVEGPGDKDAIPALIKRLSKWRKRRVTIQEPVVVMPSDHFSSDRMKGTLQTIAGRSPRPVAVLIVRDADTHPGCELSAKIRELVEQEIPHIPAGIVLPVKEYECLFLAAIRSLRGKNDVRPNASYTKDPEAIRGAKEAMSDQMTRKYSPTTDQLPMTKEFSFNQARRTYTFQKFAREFDQLTAHRARKARKAKGGA